LSPFLHIFRRFDRTPPGLTTHYTCSRAPEVFHRSLSYPQRAEGNTSLVCGAACLGAVRPDTPGPPDIREPARGEVEGAAAPT